MFWLQYSACGFKCEIIILVLLWWLHPRQGRTGLGPTQLPNDPKIRSHIKVSVIEFPRRVVLLPTCVKRTEWFLCFFLWYWAYWESDFNYNQILITVSVEKKIPNMQPAQTGSCEMTSQLTVVWVLHSNCHSKFIQHQSTLDTKMHTWDKVHLISY